MSEDPMHPNNDRYYQRRKEDRIRRRVSRKKAFARVIDYLKCDMKDNKGNHCPNDVAYRVETNKGEISYLCDKCYKNVDQGAYKGLSIKEFMNIEE